MTEIFMLLILPLTLVPLPLSSLLAPRIDSIKNRSKIKYIEYSINFGG